MGRKIRLDGLYEEKNSFYIWNYYYMNIVSGIWHPGDFRDVTEFSWICDLDLKLIFKNWDLRLWFEINFENLGSGIWFFFKSWILVWDRVIQNPGSWIPDCGPLTLISQCNWPSFQILVGKLIVSISLADVVLSLRGILVSTYRFISILLVGSSRRYTW